MQLKHLAPLLLVMALTQAAASAYANETVNKVTTKTREIAAKTTEAVGHGLKKAGEGIDHAGNKTAEVLHRVVKKIEPSSSESDTNPKKETNE